MTGGAEWQEGTKAFQRLPIRIRQSLCYTLPFVLHDWKRPVYSYENTKTFLREKPQGWLVTGVAGFVGSHLLEALLELDQHVVGLDSFVTGRESNLDDVRFLVGPERWGRFHLVRGDIRSLEECRQAFAPPPGFPPISYALHHAALASVPLSLSDPLATHTVNVAGFMNILEAARGTGLRRFVYASSSAVYGDDPASAKTEETVGAPLSPYALSKMENERSAELYARLYGLKSVGLRYFNIFGPRQDPEGPYAAVIPQWILAILRGRPPVIYGDGETSRDFCPVESAVRANILAACLPEDAPVSIVCNVGTGVRTSLNALYAALKTAAKARGLPCPAPIHKPLREGDIRHSLADISKAREMLGYEPESGFSNALERSINWYGRPILGRDGVENG